MISYLVNDEKKRKSANDTIRIIKRNRNRRVVFAENEVITEEEKKRAILNSDFVLRNTSLV